MSKSEARYAPLPTCSGCLSPRGGCARIPTNNREGLTIQKAECSGGQGLGLRRLFRVNSTDEIGIMSYLKQFNRSAFRDTERKCKHNQLFNNDLNLKQRFLIIVLESEARNFMFCRPAG